MGTVYFISGLIIFVVTALDIIKTTITTNGGGRITNFLSKRIWKAFFAASGRNGNSKLLEYAGSTILVCILMAWIVGLWLGMFLILLSEPRSILDSSTLAAATWTEKLYYAGFTLSTLGIGDFKASNDTWRIITGISAFSGLALITTSISYFLPVLSAVNLQNKISLYVNSMGKTPQQILCNSWNSKSFSSFFDSTSVLGELIMKHTLDHYSYPVINYFHNRRENMSVKLALVTLDETILLLSNAVAKEAGVDELKLTMLRNTLLTYLNTIQNFPLLDNTNIAEAPVPDLQELREAGIPVAGAGYVADKDIKRQRELLTSLLESGGWSWKDIYSH